MNCRTVTQVAVKGIENGLKASRADAYVLQVSWSDGTKYIIYRSHAEVYSMHVKLVAAFPIEAGKVSTKDKILPDLARDRQCLLEKAMANLAVYFERLLRLERKITSYPEFVSMLTLTPADMAVVKDTPLSKSSSEARQAQSANGGQVKVATHGEVNEITGPLTLETYVAVATYKSKGKTEVSLTAGDTVDVIDKNSNGWWYVRVDDQEGWAPSTYLDSASDEYRTEECPCLSGEVFLTTKAYAAQQEDELSFPCNASIEILNKIKDGWWIGSYNGKVGYVPAAYLAAYSDPYLDVKMCTSAGAAAAERPSVPVQRRNTIKGLKKAVEPDLTIYRKASEKNRTTRVVAIAAATSALAVVMENPQGAMVQHALSRGEYCNGKGPSELSPPLSTGADESSIQKEKAAAAEGEAAASESSSQAGDVQLVVVRPRAADQKARSPQSSRAAQLLTVADEPTGAAGLQ